MGDTGTPTGVTLDGPRSRSSGGEIGGWTATATTLGEVGVREPCEPAETELDISSAPLVEPTSPSAERTLAKDALQTLVLAARASNGPAPLALGPLGGGWRKQVPRATGDRKRNSAGTHQG